MTVVQIVATADCYVNNAVGQENTVNNGNTLVATGATATTKRRSFLQFPLAGNVPAGATINSARIGMAPNATVTVVTSFDFHPLIANFDWTEAGVTWNHKNTTGSVAWAGGSNGGEVDGTDIDDDTILCTTSWTNSPADAADTFKEHAITTSFIQDVSDGVGIFQNGDRIVHVHMWRQGSSNSDGIAFRSRTSSSGAFAPYLEVDYTADDPAVSGTATCRATDAVAFPQCTYTGDSDNNEVITVERKIQGAGDETYVTIPTYYDRTNKIAYGGHNVDFGAGSVVRMGDIARSSGAAYTYRFSFSGGATAQTVNQTMLTRLDPLAHSGRGTREVPTGWWWSPSNTVTAAVIRKNAWIVTTQGGSESADNAEIRNGATDIPIYNYVAPEIRIDTVNIDEVGRNTWAWDTAAVTTFQADVAETWFTHNGGSAAADRVYNRNYDTYVMNWADPGWREYAYTQFIRMLYEQHTDQEPAADRYHGIVQDNWQGTAIVDTGWTTAAADPTPAGPTEAAVNTAVEYSAEQGEFIALLKATGTYIGANTVNATDADHLAMAPELDAIFLESIFTSYHGTGDIDPLTAAGWKAAVDHVIDLTALTTHVVCAMQLGTAPSQSSVEFGAWSFAMVTDGLGAGGSVIIRPTDNNDYDHDEIESSGTTVFDVDWGTPSGDYVQDLTAPGGSGANRVYYRDFGNGRVWVNATEPAATGGPGTILTPTGGPTLDPLEGIFIASGTDNVRKRIVHQLREQGIA